MKFGYTIIYVADVKATIEFYEVAFGFVRKFITDELDYGELNTGETTLAFANLDLANANFRDGFYPNTPDAKPAAVEIAFVTDDVDAAFTRAIDAGGIEITPPTSKPWGQVVSHLRDLNGSIVELCSPINP